MKRQARVKSKIPSAVQQPEPDRSVAKDLGYDSVFSISQDMNAMMEGLSKLTDAILADRNLKKSRSSPGYEYSLSRTVLLEREYRIAKKALEKFEEELKNPKKHKESDHVPFREIRRQKLQNGDLIGGLVAHIFHKRRKEKSHKEAHEEEVAKKRGKLEEDLQRKKSKLSRHRKIGDVALPSPSQFPDLVDSSGETPESSFKVPEEIEREKTLEEREAAPVKQGNTIQDVRLVSVGEGVWKRLESLMPPEKSHGTGTGGEGSNTIIGGVLGNVAAGSAGAAGAGLLAGGAKFAGKAAGPLGGLIAGIRAYSAHKASGDSEGRSRAYLATVLMGSIRGGLFGAAVAGSRTKSAYGIAAGGIVGAFLGAEAVEKLTSALFGSIDLQEKKGTYTDPNGKKHSITAYPDDSWMNRRKESFNLSDEQKRNAKLLEDEGTKQGMSPDQIAALKAVSFGESSLIPQSIGSYTNTPNNKIREEFPSLKEMSDAELSILKRDNKLLLNKGLGEGKKADALGNIQEGDGYKFQPRGLNQLTGRSNYKKFGDMINEDLITNPEKANEPEVAAKLAVAYATSKANMNLHGQSFLEDLSMKNYGKNPFTDPNSKLAQTQQSAFNMFSPSTPVAPQIAPVSVRRDGVSVELPDDKTSQQRGISSENGNTTVVHAPTTNVVNSTTNNNTTKPKEIPRAYNPWVKVPD